MITKILLLMNSTAVKTLRYYVVELILLLARVCIGVAFFVAGKGKLDFSGEGIAKPKQFLIDMLERYDVPYYETQSYFVAYGEMIGGILLAIGLFGRAVGAMFSVMMLVAYSTVHSSALSKATGFVDTVATFTNEAPFPYLIVALFVLCHGAGLFSCDRIIYLGFINKRKINKGIRFKK